MNPAGPYSIFHTVDVPASVHATSVEVNDKLEEVKSVGSGHVGIFLTWKLSTNTSTSSGSLTVPSDPKIPN